MLDCGSEARDAQAGITLEGQSAAATPEAHRRRKAASTCNRYDAARHGNTQAGSRASVISVLQARKPRHSSQVVGLGRRRPDPRVSSHRSDAQRHRATQS